MTLLTRIIRNQNSLGSGDLVIWVLAALHTLAALSLLIVLGLVTPAHALEKNDCGGHNLLAELQANDPAAYEEIGRQAAKVANNDSVFWKIEKDGLAPSYLLGTAHLSDPRILELPAGADGAFAAANTLIIESTDLLDPKKASATLLSNPELTTFTDGKTIYDYLDDKETAMLEEELAKRGVPLFAVSKMKPWMLATLVAESSCETTRKGEGLEFLDKKLASDATAQGKEVIGLETMTEQLQIMASMPVEFHLKQLIETLEKPQLAEDMIETLIVLYDEGKPGWFRALSEHLYPEDEGGFSVAEFEQVLITKRNHIMADRALPSLDKGAVFMAVGALHLPGAEGIVELLRQKGFTVTAVR